MSSTTIYLYNDGWGYTDVLENKYGRDHNFTELQSDQEKAIQKGIELLQNPALKEESTAKRNRMLEDKIDVTGYLIDVVENYFS